MTAVPPHVVDAEGHGPAFRHAREVVIIHLDGFSAPGPPPVLEVADQLLLLRIDADDRQPGGSERRPAGGDVPELLIAVWVLGTASPFLGALEREAHRLE